MTQFLIFKVFRYMDTWRSSCD